MEFKETNKKTKVGEYNKLFIVHKKTKTIVSTTLLIDQLKYLIPLSRELKGIDGYELVMTDEGYKILNKLFEKLWNFVRKSRGKIERTPFHRAFFSSKTDDKGNLIFFVLPIKIVNNLVNYLTIKKEIIDGFVFFKNEAGDIWQTRKIITTKNMMSVLK